MNKHDLHMKQTWHHDEINHITALKLKVMAIIKDYGVYRVQRDCQILPPADTSQKTLQKMDFFQSSIYGFMGVIFTLISSLKVIFREVSGGTLMEFCEECFCGASKGIFFFF